jgi:transcriptional regulator with XRE-family HTH domain
LISRREDLGYTQEEVAFALDMSRVGYVNFENGKRGMVPQRLKLLAELMGMRERDIMGNVTNESITADA